MAIFTPDDFAYDWYGFLTNQISHASIAVFHTWFLTFTCLVLTDEFPYKWALFFTLGALYLLFELTFQGWKGWDTVEDWIFYSVYGAGGTVMTFHEYKPGSSVATFDLAAPTLIFPVMAVHLFTGCIVRVLRAANA